MIGQAPNLNGASWGGYPGWEEFNGIIRGIQLYSGLLSVAEIRREIAIRYPPRRAETELVLEPNPRPGDVADKKGSAPRTTRPGAGKPRSSGSANVEDVQAAREGSVPRRTWGPRSFTCNRVGRGNAKGPANAWAVRSR